MNIPTLCKERSGYEKICLSNLPIDVVCLHRYYVNNITHTEDWKERNKQKTSDKPLNHTGDITTTTVFRYRGCDLAGLRHWQNP